jgi:chemotaxis protein methyltransferase CheR
LIKYFIKDGVSWQLKKELQDMFTYKTSNLLKNFATLVTFDLVFYHNVLIYFDQETKRHILDRIAKMSKIDGVVYLGGVVTVLSITDNVEFVLGQSGIYELFDK